MTAPANDGRRAMVAPARQLGALGLAMALAACDAAAPDDNANAADPLADPALVTAPEFAIAPAECNRTGLVGNLPEGDFLSVREGPGTEHRQFAKLNAGVPVLMCNSVKDGRWTALAFRIDGTMPEAEACFPKADAGANGKAECRTGWVAARYLLENEARSDIVDFSDDDSGAEAAPEPPKDLNAAYLSCTIESGRLAQAKFRSSNWDALTARDIGKTVYFRFDKGSSSLRMNWAGTIDRPHVLGKRCYQAPTYYSCDDEDYGYNWLSVRLDRLGRSVEIQRKMRYERYGDLRWITHTGSCQILPEDPYVPPPTAF